MARLLAIRTFLCFTASPACSFSRRFQRITRAIHGPQGSSSSEIWISQAEKRISKNVRTFPPGVPGSWTAVYPASSRFAEQYQSVTFSPARRRSPPTTASRVAVRRK